MATVAGLKARGGNVFSGPLVITGALVLVVMSLVMPLPAHVLDFGIALSIATSTLVLVMASLVNRPTDFQAFPILLLVTLVIRLSLNVSSTRLILTNGHTGKDAAGQVINGFADFVAGGSLLVGLTVFGVISVVNFMVITKGSGRMAEVAARFALDSLPGKQLAIDSDVSSGAITHDEAKQRRAQEQREISFFGSLDGASKFVKGDAIAGLVITFINLLVGLAVGVIVHGMPVGTAVSTYSHLTIGDGLVSQVPSLITSMAAALLLSRGGATDDTASLILREFTSRWHASAVVAVTMVFMGLVPGMPTLLFWAMAAAMAVLSRKIATRPAPLPEPVAPKAETAAPASRLGDVLDTDEISIEIGADLVAMALDPGRGLGTRITNLRIHITRSYGLIIPDVRISDTEDLNGGDYRIRILGVVRGRGVLVPNKIMALGDDSALASLPGPEVREPVYHSPARWITRDEQDEAASMGATIVSPMEILSTHLMEVVKANMAALLSMSAMQRQIEALKSVSDTERAERNRKFFDSMIPDKVTPETLLAVLRMLLDEGVPIRNLTMIVDAICEFRHLENTETIAEMVRKRLRGQITQHYGGDRGQIDVIQLHPAWEAEFVRSDQESGRSGGVVNPALAKRLVTSARQAMSLVQPAAQPVIAAPDHRRRMVKAVLNANGIATPVLGLEELDPETQLNLIATIEAA